MQDEKELKKVIELISSHIISKINDKNIAKIVTGKVVRCKQYEQNMCR